MTVANWGKSLNRSRADIDARRERIADECIADLRVHFSEEKVQHFLANGGRAYLLALLAAMLGISVEKPE